MTKTKIRKLLGKRAVVYWRDPQTDARWTDSPLKTRSSLADTEGRLLGFNKEGELIVAGSHAVDPGEPNEPPDWADRTAIPLCLIEKIEHPPKD